MILKGKNVELRIGTEQSLGFLNTASHSYFASDLLFALEPRVSKTKPWSLGVDLIKLLLGKIGSDNDLISRCSGFPCHRAKDARVRSFSHRPCSSACFLSGVFALELFPCSWASQRSHLARSELMVRSILGLGFTFIRGSVKGGKSEKRLLCDKRAWIASRIMTFMKFENAHQRNCQGFCWDALLGCLRYHEITSV